MARTAVGLANVTLLDLERVELLGDIGRLSACGRNFDDLCERLLIKGGEVVLNTVCESQDRWPHSLRDTRIAGAFGEKAIAATTIVGSPHGDILAASAYLGLYHDSTAGTTVASDLNIPAARDSSKVKTVEWASTRCSSTAVIGVHVWAMNAVFAVYPTKPDVDGRDTAREAKEGCGKLHFERVVGVLMDRTTLMKTG
jgi:hypothetical protein